MLLPCLVSCLPILKNLCKEFLLNSQQKGGDMRVGLAGTDREFAQADYAERINLKTMGCKVLKRENV